MTEDYYVPNKIIRILDENTCIAIDSYGRTIFQKTMSIYEKPVFQYLLKHPSPHIPMIFDYKEENGKLVVSEQYIDGISLAEKLDDSSFSDNERKSVFLQLLEAVQFLHHAEPKIIHRDIKPANIMIDQDGAVFLVDYDSARIYVANKERDTVLMGTEGYAAPEQYGFGESDERTDIYALGKLLKNMFPDQKKISAVANHAMAMDPKDRYESVEALRSALMNPGCLYNWLPIPGFRTKKVWKEIIAVLIYGFVVLICTQMTYTNSATSKVAAGFDLFWVRFCVFGLFISLNMLWMKWTPVFSFMKKTEKLNVAVRILIYFGLSCVIVFFWLLLISPI